MRSDSSVPSKLCPRCGAFYQDLKSQTCPQCFARLEVLDKDTARHLSEEQSARVVSPDFREAKAEADERFKEQSFGACLVVTGIVLATIIIAFVFIRLAATRRHLPTSSAPAPPAAAALLSPEMLLPAIVGGYPRRAIHAEGNLPGTTAPLYRGLYAGGIQVYAVATSGATQDEENALRLAATLASEQHNPPLLVQEITTPRAQYAILGETEQSIARVATSLSTTNRTP